MVLMRNKKNYPSIIMKYPLLFRALSHAVVSVRIASIGCSVVGAHRAATGQTF